MSFRAKSRLLNYRTNSCTNHTASRLSLAGASSQRGKAARRPSRAVCTVLLPHPRLRVRFRRWREGEGDTGSEEASKEDTAAAGSG